MQTNTKTESLYSMYTNQGQGFIAAGRTASMNYMLNLFNLVVLQGILLTTGCDFVMPGQTYVSQEQVSTTVTPG